MITKTNTSYNYFYAAAILVQPTWISWLAQGWRFSVFTWNRRRRRESAVLEQPPYLGKSNILTTIPNKRRGPDDVSREDHCWASLKQHWLQTSFLLSRAIECWVKNGDYKKTPQNTSKFEERFICPKRRPRISIFLWISTALRCDNFNERRSVYLSKYGTF